MKGKVAIVTGAASGIGRAASELLAEEGAVVVALDIDPAGDAVAAAIARRGSSAMFVRTDVTRAADCRAAVRAACRIHGGVDILVNVAGIIRRADIVETREADWDRVMETNVKSMFLLSREAIPSMIDRGGGSIVNLASGWGLAAGPRAAVYCASKGAVVQLTKAMAIDHAADGIRVNCVCPGDVDTPMLAREAAQLGASDEGFLREAADRPAGRIGSPQEVASAILFLAGEDSRYVNGTSLVIDGGGLLA